jgi:hypothetical protein
MDLDKGDIPFDVKKNRRSLVDFLKTIKSILATKR